MHRFGAVVAVFTLLACLVGCPPSVSKDAQHLLKHDITKAKWGEAAVGYIEAEQTHDASGSACSIRGPWAVVRLQLATHPTAVGAPQVHDQNHRVYGTPMTTIDVFEEQTITKVRIAWTTELTLAEHRDMDFSTPYHIHQPVVGEFPVTDSVAHESCFLVHSDGSVIFGCGQQRRKDNYERVRF
jgi:hypothetical protein